MYSVPKKADQLNLSLSLSSCLHCILMSSFFVFFCKHAKSPVKDWQDLFVLMADVLIMISQCRCMRPPSQSYMEMHTAYGSESNMAANAGRVMRFHKQAKILKNSHEARPSIKNRITNLLTKV